MKMILGEKREVKIQITSTKDDPFTIRNAQWELSKRGESVESSGECDVYGDELSAFVKPKEDGNYVLEFTYNIANEILISQIQIEVSYYATKY